MTNFEKYKDDILDIAEDNCNIAYSVSEQKVTVCGKETCDDCLFIADTITSCGAGRLKWLYDEAEEVNWTNVPVNTKIYVRNKDDHSWEPRYFSHYHSESHTVYAFAAGATIWSVDKYSNGTPHTISWRQAKLAEEDEES